MGGTPASYYFAKYPIRRILANQLITLGNDELATLNRLQMLVWRNPQGMRGNGCVYADGGQKADKEWVLNTLTRLGGIDRQSLRRCLNHLKQADEVTFDKGRPCLKHWHRDREREPTVQAERKKQLRDRDFVPEAVELLPMFLRSGEARTISSLCGWLGYKMKKDAKSTLKRVVDLLVDDGVIDVGDDGVFSVCSSALPSAASPPRHPPSLEPEEHEAIDLDTSQTCPADRDLKSKAKEVFYENPKEPLEGAPGGASIEGRCRGGEAAYSDVRSDHAGSSAPVGRGNVVRDGPRARGIQPTAQSSRRRSRSFSYDRSLSGQYRGWVDGTHPHPHLETFELQEFRSTYVHTCDLIDGMLYLAPDGAPPGRPPHSGGQEALFKSVLKQINGASGGVAAADDPVRRVLLEFTEDLQLQNKPFDCDASVLMSKLKKLDSELRDVKR